MRFILLFNLLFAAGLVMASQVDYIPVPAKDLVKHTYYTLSYNETNEEANWVYYVLTDSMVMNKGEERSNRFKVDEMVPTGSAKSSDYTKSGYDRGHLCPAADMEFNRVAMNESFLMSNVTPQTPDFNRGIWKELETDVRKWALKDHRLIVVAGPVFKDNKGKIGIDKVTVPGYFFKLIFEANSSPKLIAFLIPNEKTNRPLTDFAVPTDELEKLTGYDFFSQLPDGLETKLESKVELAAWFDDNSSGKSLANQSDFPPAKNHPDLFFYMILVGALVLAIIFVYLKGRKRS